MNNRYAVYILANKRNGTLYIGVTNDLVRRITDHTKGEGSRFTREYGVNRLVFYEFFDDISDALRREKQLKNWKRAWKISLIEEQNPSGITLLNRDSDLSGSRIKSGMTVWDGQASHNFLGWKRLDTSPPPIDLEPFTLSWGAISGESHFKRDSLAKPSRIPC